MFRLFRIWFQPFNKFYIDIYILIVSSDLLPSCSFMLIVTLLLAVLLSSPALQEHNLVVTKEKQAFMEIKYEQLDLETGKGYQISCNNGTTLPITTEHRSFHNGMPIYRIALGSATGTVGNSLVCVMYQVGKKEYVGSKARTYSQIQKPKGRAPEGPFTVDLVNLKQLSLYDNLLLNQKPLNFVPEYMEAIVLIEQQRTAFLADLNKERKKRARAKNNKKRNELRSEKQLALAHLSFQERVQGLHQTSSPLNQPGTATSTDKKERDETREELQKFSDLQLQLLDFPPQQGIKEALGNRKVYLSLTTSPKRLPFLHHVFKALDTTLISEIFVCIPRYFRNNSKEPYTIQTDMFKHFPKVRIIAASHDPGPCLKVVGSAKYLREHNASPDDLLIYIDDDIAYSKTMVDTLVMLALTIPHSVIGGSGLNDWITHFGFAPFSRDNKPLVEPAVVLEGFAAVIAPLMAIDYELILAFCDSLTPSCTFSDDLIVSWIFAYNGFPLYGIRTDVPLSFYSRNALRELPSANLGALKDKSHDNPGDAGFGANFNRYNEAAYLLFLTTLDIRTKNLQFKERADIIASLRQLALNQQRFTVQ